MKPTAWLAAYFPVLKRSIPSTTYRRQSPASLPAIRLHSMMACGRCSLYSSRMSWKKTGMSVRPSGLETSGRESVSVPGRTVIFFHRAATLGAAAAFVFTASCMPARRCSVISTSPTPAMNFPERPRPASNPRRESPESRLYVPGGCR